MIDQMAFLKKVAEKRKAVEGKQNVVDGLQKFVEETSEFQQLNIAEEGLGRLQYDLKTMEVEYREICLQSFKETGEKKQPGGVMGIYTKLDYDQAEALEWVLAHGHVDLVSLKKKDFETIAKSFKPDFVEISEVPRMKLSKDFSKWLEGETDA